MGRDGGMGLWILLVLGKYYYSILERMEWWISFVLLE
jgi:hypothetical protein